MQRTKSAISHQLKCLDLTFVSLLLREMEELNFDKCYYIFEKKECQKTFDMKLNICVIYLQGLMNYLH